VTPPPPAQRLLEHAAFVFRFAVLGLAVAFVATLLWPERFGRSPPAPATVGSPAAGPISYRDAVARAAPSVVNLYSTRIVANPAWRIFSDPLTQRSVQVPTLRPELRQSIGSGVLVSAEGHVLTNYHVIADAREILVGLHDGRITTATVVGTDAETDLAVLHIEGSGFPAARFADPAHPLAVGDVVLAIGNPFRIGQTVTHGIVSATGRDQPTLSRYEDFIQTDAAINTGNSGGALVNAAGELVGINTAQFGPGLGINFAIPAAAAKRVLDEILERGYVRRGWLGIEYATRADAAAGWDPATRGVHVVGVAPGAPAEVAGLRGGDVLLALDGTPIADEGDLRNREAALAVGGRVRVSGTRNGIPFEIEVEVAERPRDRR
jgi:serine protease DegS/serine protease DegQ